MHKLATACSNAEFVVLFGVLQSQWLTTHKNIPAGAVCHFKLDLRLVFDGLQNNAEGADVLGVVKWVAIGIPVVDVVVAGGKQRLNLLQPVKANVKQLDAWIQRNCL